MRLKGKSLAWLSGSRPSSSGFTMVGWALLRRSEEKTDRQRYEQRCLLQPQLSELRKADVLWFTTPA